ncbi:signal peptide peptidase SppA [Pedobacter chitinilyticus]|uniref:Signal peptide peptidase SppA n=1 Tax=Pedobacter chitinilyticus TaxID=2233776 RepID=A0A3S3PZH3_9SPHI|nr:signal peptide peptidase SppA [Pedobacter chitinilyticus]RWU08212.1 signal peptide peptidase SppA [Pedobacter chitinilyticus]
MKEFFKYVFATVVGIVISAVVLGILGFVIIVGIISSFDSDTKAVVKANSVLYLNLDQAITERTPKESFGSMFFGNGNKSIGFNDVIRALEKAKTDENIQAVYINVMAPNAGMATLLEVRNAILDFKTSKKPVIAYSEVYSQGAYYLASAASKVYLNPEGDLEFKGFSANLMFFKGALDKLGVEPQIIRVGNYKSAVEPFINTKMSDYNRQQVSVYVNGLYQTFLAGISESRKLSTDSLFQIANQLKIQAPNDALTHKMVDGLKYKDEVLDELRNITGKGKKDDINSITINDYIKDLPSQGDIASKNKVAVIYANGEIIGGEGSDEQIGSERISRAIRKARLDEDVKAIVLRVNSGGGSALASDVIWREIELSKKIKPVIASFGDVAASGGYYIGCAADSIFVQPNTITGSIGVFGMFFNAQKLMNEKLGITFDGVKTGQYADIMSANRPMTPAERLILQRGVNNIYNTFITKVANGRKKTKAQIDSLGGGRVWTGKDAVTNGLADRIGSFGDAISSAAKKAKLKDYKVVEYPEKIDPIKEFLGAAKDNVSAYYAKKEFGENYVLYQQMKKAMSQTGIQARLDHEIIIK